MIYCNCKMHLLQFSFNRFEIMQDPCIGYKHCGLCSFDDQTVFGFLAFFMARLRVVRGPLSGCPPDLENLENLENGVCIFQSGKSQGK